MELIEVQEFQGIEFPMETTKPSLNYTISCLGLMVSVKYESIGKFYWNFHSCFY